MKIVQINAVYRNLSTGVNVYEMNRAFRAQGHQCIAAFAVGAVNEPTEEYKIGTTLGQKTHALLSRITGLQGYFSRFSTKKLLRFMDQFQPDVVVLNNLHANYIHLPILLKYLARKDIPTVTVLHDCWFYTGKCCYYTAEGCEKWKTYCGNCPAKKQYNKSWFFDRSRKIHKDRIKLFGAIPQLGVVAVSDWLCEQAKQSPVFANAKEITRIHNWIDTDVFAPADRAELKKELKLEDKKILLAVAAVWETRKGLDALLSIAEQLTEDERLVVVGNLKNKTNLPTNMLHIDRTESKEALAQYYSMADVFLQPSLEETFGKVTAEALSCGTPVVCFDSTANPELVGENCGAVVPAGDVEGMLREARKILANGKAEYSDACRSAARIRFDANNSFKQYMKLCHHLQEEQTEKALKVIQINAVCDSGSTGRTCKELNEALLQAGHYGLILYGNGNSQYPYGRKIEGNMGIKVHALLSRLLGKNAAYSPMATRKALKIIKAYKPDVVHLRNLHGNFINLKPLLRYLAKNDIPTVVTLHDCWIFTGKCTHYTQTGCNKWQTGCYDCPRLKKDIPSLFLDRTPEMWEEKSKLLQEIPRLAVTGVSDWVTAEGEKSPFFANAKEIKRIYNWIDLDVFYPRQDDICRQYGIKKEKQTILCIGAGWHQKADKTKDLIKLAERLGADYQILLAGAVACEENFPANISRIGYVRDTEELAKLYSAVDVYVHLSREDTFGKVIAEAMACGTPAVVYNSTACPELVADGCGYAVATGDTDAVADAVRKITQQGKEKYSACCVENVRQRFAKDSLVQETLKLYKMLCQSDRDTK